MQLINLFAQDDQGTVIPGATCYLYEPGTELLVTGLQDVNGAPLANPFSADDDGLVQFAAPNGQYDLRAVGWGRDYRLRVKVFDGAQFEADLANATDPAKGPALIGFRAAGGSAAPRNMRDKAREIVSIKDYGAVGDGIADDLAAFGAARDVVGASGCIRLIGPGTYYFAGNRPSLSGVNIWADPDVTIKVDESPNTKDMKLLTPVRIENPVHDTSIVKSANTKIQLPELFNVAPGLVDIATDEVSTLENFGNWSHKVYITSTGDISTNNGTATVTQSQLTWASDFVTNPQVSYPNAITEGALYEVNAFSTVYDGKKLGVFCKTANRVWTASVTQDAATINIVERDFTGSVINNSSPQLPNGGAYGWLTGQEVNIGFVLKGGVTTLVVCGLPVFKFPAGATVAGFYFDNGGSYTDVIVKDPIKTTNYRTRLKKPLSIGVIGDSISYGAWCSNDITDLLPSFVQNLPQIGKVSVSNYAVSGTASDYWATGAGASVNLSQHDVVLCMLGTNDLQTNVSVATYTSNLADIADNIVAAGATPVFGVFPIFTSAAISGVTGVATTNYALHAKYTHALKKFCIQNGYTFADVRRNFGYNVGWYGDNIHPTVEGQIAVMAAWAESISKSVANETGWLLD